MFLENPNWELSLINREFLKGFPGADREQLELALNKSEYIKSALENKHWIPGMGPTFHGALPFGIRIPGYTVPEISIVAKPVVDYFAAEQEYHNSELSRSRGLNVPPSICLLRDGDAAIIISQLMHTAQPLSARDLSYSQHHPEIYTPFQLLKDFGSAIGVMHNLGIVHGDLHLGNIGHQFHVDSPPSVIFFDLEYSTVLSNSDLIIKNSGNAQNLRQHAKFERFEKDAIADVARFATSLRRSGLPLKRGQLLENLVNYYTEVREPSFAYSNGKKLRRLIGAFYNQFQKELKSPHSQLAHKAS